jgi:hypothetical protein
MRDADAAVLGSPDVDVVPCMHFVRVARLITRS